MLMTEVPNYFWSAARVSYAYVWGIPQDMSGLELTSGPLRAGIWTAMYLTWGVATE